MSGKEKGKRRISRAARNGKYEIAAVASQPRNDSYFLSSRGRIIGRGDLVFLLSFPRKRESSHFFF
jgi:hypothetical protein